MNEQVPDPEIIKDCVRQKMPFGKYKGIFYDQLPVSYLEWLSRQGFPAGRAGMILATVYEIKINGLSSLFSEIRRRLPPTL
jgi:uncharacterized protein (DUF3820 family)